MIEIVSPSITFAAVAGTPSTTTSDGMKPSRRIVSLKCTLIVSAGASIEASSPTSIAATWNAGAEKAEVEARDQLVRENRRRIPARGGKCLGETRGQDRNDRDLLRLGRVVVAFAIERRPI